MQPIPIDKKYRKNLLGVKVRDSLEPYYMSIKTETIF